MEIHIVESLAEPVGNLWRKLQSEPGPAGFSVAAPLSSTPMPIYEWLIKNSENIPNWDSVNFILMDDQVEGKSLPFAYVPKSDAASYEGFAEKHFLSSLRAKTGADVNIIKPELDTISSFNPTIDLLVLALGAKGNYANVMPGTAKSVGWHVAHLTPEFSQSHTRKDSQSYANAEFREFGMSLGPQQVLSAQHVAVIISGAHKRELAEQLLSYKEFDSDFPLSIIFDEAVADRVKVFVTEDVEIK